tara:strand:+ start:301 stop:972 length:672 start_codon:yes stop_codon:yes gene_type:complete
MKIAIITSIFGLNTKLRDPSNKFDGVDYIAFVDHKHDCSVWEQRNALNFTLDNKYNGRRNAKIYKVLPQMFLPEYDYWFWVDSTHEVIVHPKEIIEKYLGESEIGLWKHTDRNCSYKEAEIINQLNYDHKSLVNEQINYYSSMGYPKNNGLYELPVSIRKNTDNTKILNLRWWEQICRYSSRDQISMPFVLWKTNITPKLLPGYANGGLNANPIMPQVRYKGQ